MKKSEKILDKKDLLALYDNTNAELFQLLYSLNEKEFNTIPFEGSWTAGQVSEHIIKSLDGINQLVNAPTQSTTRDPEQYVNDLRQMMENFDVKKKSAPNLLPGNEPLAKATIQNRLLQSKEQLLKSIHNLDLMETCVALDFPGIGQLTRFELISFAAFHTQRHIQQMKNIYKILNGNQS